MNVEGYFCNISVPVSQQAMAGKLWRLRFLLSLFKPPATYGAIAASAHLCQHPSTFASIFLFILSIYLSPSLSLSLSLSLLCAISSYDSYTVSFIRAISFFYKSTRFSSFHLWYFYIKFYYSLLSFLPYFSP